MTENMAQKLIKVQDVKPIYGIAESLVLIAIKDGSLKCKQVGRAKILEIKDVEKWIKTFEGES